MGRDQSPNAGRKAEAGSQAGHPQLQVAANFAPGCLRERRPERRAGSGGHAFRAGSNPTTVVGLDDLCPHSAPHQRTNSEW
jgi:hypothetical protein